DIALVTHGNIIEEVVKAREQLKKDGFNVSLVSSPTVKPFDKVFFDELTKTHGHIYVVEEHSEIGGLGDALSYLGARNIAIPDRILYEGGDVNHLRKLPGIDSESIYRRVKQEV